MGLRDIVLLLGIVVGCDGIAGPASSPSAPPSPAPPEDEGGHCEYDDVSEPCRAERVEVRDRAAGTLTITYRGVRVPGTLTANVRVPPDRIEEARELYRSTPGTCEASVITQGSCPDVLHESVTPPPLPEP